jgi:hypothetical protein
MRFLCNENIPKSLVVALAGQGHDVVWVRELRPGIVDAEVLAWAIREARICITFDKDFGELAGATPLPANCGVILPRLPPSPSTQWAEGIASAISARADWAGNFAVMEPGRLRIRGIAPDK